MMMVIMLMVIIRVMVLVLRVLSQLCALPGLTTVAAARMAWAL